MGPGNYFKKKAPRADGNKTHIKTRIYFREHDHERHIDDAIELRRSEHRVEDAASFDDMMKIME